MRTDTLIAITGTALRRILIGIGAFFVVSSVAVPAFANTSHSSNHAAPTTRMGSTALIAATTPTTGVNPLEIANATYNCGYGVPATIVYEVLSSPNVGIAVSGYYSNGYSFTFGFGPYSVPGGYGEYWFQANPTSSERVTAIAVSINSGFTVNSYCGAYHGT